MPHPAPAPPPAEPTPQELRLAIKAERDRWGITLIQIADAARVATPALFRVMERDPRWQPQPRWLQDVSAALRRLSVARARAYLAAWDPDYAEFHAWAEQRKAARRAEMERRLAAARAA